MLKKYLLSSVYRMPDDETGVDPEVARKAQIEADRAKVKVTSVKIEDEPEEKEVETKEDDEQEKEDGKEEGEKEDKEVENEKEDDEEKEELRLQRRYERTEKKLIRADQRRREAEKRIKELEAKIAADPEKTLTEEDVETLAEKKANDKQLIKEYNAAADKLADGAEKHLKMKSKNFNKLVAETLEDLGIDGFPGEIVGALNEMDNGPIILAHLLKNPDELEQVLSFKTRPIKLGMELTALSTKLSTPPKKKISQVPDPVEPLGGKATTADRLSFLMSKKNKTQEEMNEYVLARNADVAAKRANGRGNLR